MERLISVKEILEKGLIKKGNLLKLIHAGELLKVKRVGGYSELEGFPNELWIEMQECYVGEVVDDITLIRMISIEMLREYEDQIFVAERALENCKKKYPNFFEHAHKKESTTAKNDFIAGLKISFESDNDILIQEHGKIPKPVTCQSVGFRDNSTIGWKTLIRILQESPHTFCVGPAFVNNDRTTYDSKQKILLEINKKLINFINKEFSQQISEKYKLYELCSNEEPGTYRFKFQIGFDYDYDKSYYENRYKSLSKTDLKNQISKLHKKSQESPNKQVMEKLTSACIVARDKYKMSESEIKELIK